MTTDDAALLAVAQKANALFVIPGGIERILKPVSTASARLSSPYREIADAFETNIRSVIVTAGLPYMFALESSHRRRYQLLQCAAELEAVLAGSSAEASTADGQGNQPCDAQADAAKRLSALSDTPTGRASLNQEACSVLLNVADSDNVREAASQLVLQAATLTWGAFEVAARDVVRAYLNLRPDAYTRLMSDPEVKKRFELTKISMQHVANLGFDLSSKLGELLAEQNDLTDLGTIKVTLSALFPHDARLRTALNERALWVLFQQRHLIVHRRGVVDRRYLEATGDTRSVGASVVLTPRELNRHVEVVVDAASSLLEAAAG
jgi:hypothetical protein